MRHFATRRGKNPCPPPKLQEKIKGLPPKLQGKNQGTPPKLQGKNQVPPPGNLVPPGHISIVRSLSRYATLYAYY